VSRPEAVPAPASSEQPSRAPAPPIAAQSPTTGRSVAAIDAAGERVTPARPSSSSDAYSVELALLQRARGAVAGGRFTAALSAISEHERRFPAGHLSEEREALRIKALAGSGKDGEAQRAAAKFRAEFPNSVLSPRIEAATRQAP
jgi:hypothetical protein